MKTIFTSMLLAVLALGLVGCPNPQTADTSTSTGNEGTNSGTN